MPNNGIVRGQSVSREKVQLSKELRSRMTPQEAVVWQRLRANRLGGLHFRRQQIIGGFLADFYCHAAGVVIELDGRIHLQQADYDHERDQVIAAHGLAVMRISDDDVDHNLEAVLRQIETACRSRMP